MDVMQSDMMVVCAVCVCVLICTCMYRGDACESLLLYNTLYAHPVSVSIREKGEGRIN
jgi:hypothetical protein